MTSADSAARLLHPHSGAFCNVWVLRTLPRIYPTLSDTRVLMPGVWSAPYGSSGLDGACTCLRRWAGAVGCSVFAARSHPLLEPRMKLEEWPEVQAERCMFGEHSSIWAGPKEFTPLWCLYPICHEHLLLWRGCS